MKTEQQKSLDEALIRLCKNKDFIEYLSLMRDFREMAIEGMEGATTDKLHQIAGAITVYNSILNNAKAWAALEKRDAGKRNP